MIRILAAALGAFWLMAGCAPAATTPDAEPGEASQAVTDLPYAQGRAFDNLDDYLAHLKRRGAADVPFYEKAGPDLYRLVTGRRPPWEGRDERLFTRAELEEKYGFSSAAE